MEISRITSKGQTTIPKRIRESCGLREGDSVAFSVEDGAVIMRKIAAPTDTYLQGLEDTLSEWTSAEDDEAFRDL